MNMFQDNLINLIKEHLYDALVPLLMKNIELITSSSEEERVELLYECINRALYNSGHDNEPKPIRNRVHDNEPKPRRNRVEAESEDSEPDAATGLNSDSETKKRGRSETKKRVETKKQVNRKKKCSDDKTDKTETASNPRQHALLQDVIRNKYSKFTVASLREILKTKENVGVSYSKLKKHELIELLVTIESRPNDTRPNDKQSKQSKQSKPQKRKISKNSRHNFEGVEFRKRRGDASFKIGALIDSGGMGDVYMCTRDNLPDTYAIKIEQDGLTLLYESNILRKLAGSEENHIIPLLSCGWLDSTNCDSISDGHRYYYMVTPLMDVSLKNLKYENKPDKVQKVAQQILVALEYLHDRGYSHNDVKPDNIMRKDNVFYLIDFGMCTKINKTSKHVGGTPRYQPLDSYEKMQNFTRVNDVESLLYTMADVYDTLPWTDNDDAKTTKAMKKQWLETSSRNIPQVFESLVFEINNATTLTYQLDS